MSLSDAYIGRGQIFDSKTGSQDGLANSFSRSLRVEALTGGGRVLTFRRGRADEREFWDSDGRSMREQEPNQLVFPVCLISIYSVPPQLYYNVMFL